MYEINGTTIRLTRGDTFEATVAMISKVTGEEYTPVEGDVVRFAMKHNCFNESRTAYIDTEPLIEKTIPNDTLLLRLDPNDTKTLAFGDYVYDCEITFADGDVDTFINGATISILPEVD